MRSHFKDAIKYEMTELVKEDIPPIPCVVLDNIMGFRLDPEIKNDQANPADPAKKMNAKRKAMWDSEMRKGEETVGEKIAVARSMKKIDGEWTQKNGHT